MTGAQLSAMEIERTELRRLLRSAELRRARRNVFASRDATLDSYGTQTLAACLALGGLVAASGLTAARLWGLWSSYDEIEVSVRHPRRPKLGGVLIHRSRDLTRGHVTTLDGVLVTTPARTLVDLGRVLPEREVLRLLEHCLATDLIVLGRVRQHRIEVGVQGRNGAGVIHRAMDLVAADACSAESGPEATVMRLLRESGLPAPVPQLWVTAGGQARRIDLAYPSHRIAIEYDGEAWHSDPIQLLADRQRQASLEDAGWTVLRLRKTDLDIGPWSDFLDKLRPLLQPAAA